MKKTLMILLAIVFILFALSACTNEEKENDMLKYSSGVYHDKNWGETVGSYTRDAISDKETAIEIAKVIFNGLQKSKAAQEYVPQSVFYDEEDEIWIITFWKNSNEITLGGDCSIAIQKKDGKVLRIWFGE